MAQNRPVRQTRGSNHGAPPLGRSDSGHDRVRMREVAMRERVRLTNDSILHRQC